MANDVAFIGSQGMSVPVPKIAGLSVLKGIMMYGATLTFAALYVYFIVRISATGPAHQARFDSSLVTVAATLAGVLGSAFALEVGTTTPAAAANSALHDAVSAVTPGGPRRGTLRVRAWQCLSLEASSPAAPSIPMSVGIWVYAGVAERSPRPTCSTPARRPARSRRWRWRSAAMW